MVTFLVLFALIPFFQTLDFGFVNYDDPLHVSEQPEVLGGLSSEGIGWAAKATPANLWHPLTWISYMAEVQLFGGGAENPGVHHGGNVFLYALTILLFYLLVRKFGLPALWASVGVLFFAWHPLHSEPVAWISARKDLLSGVFVLGCLLSYVLSSAASGRAGLIWKLVSLITFAAALLSKPSAVVLPALLILLDWFPLRQVGFESTDGFSMKKMALRQLRSKGIYFAMALAAALIAISVQGEGSHRDFAEESSLMSRLIDAPGHVAFYFQRLLWPTGMVFEYSRPEGNGAAIYAIGGLILALGLTVLAWKARKSFPEIMLAWLWVLACLAPVLGFFYLGSSYTADRYFYLALMGPALALASFLQRETRWKKEIASASLLALVVLGVLTFKQTKVWRDDFSLFSHAVSVDPENLTALGNLGSYYRVQKDDEKALKYYEAALAINPNDHIVHYNVAHLRNNQGDRKGSIAAFRACLDGYSNYERGHHFLGIMLADQNYQETYSPEEGLFHLKKAFDLKPDDPRFALNYIYHLHRQGRLQEAAEETARALRTLPPGASTVKERLKKWLKDSRR